MDTSELRSNQEMADNKSIECWDDDDDLQCHDDIQFRTASVATSVTSVSARRSGHRDSISSRRSNRSECDSNAGGDEDWQVLLQDNEDSITQDAVTSAKRAGIPIPPDVPKSALLGGTIKRLGGKKTKRVVGDDWSDDLELPGDDGELKLKKNDDADFPESLRRLSSLKTINPGKDRDLARSTPDTLPRAKSSVTSSLDKFRDIEDDGTFDDVPTIKVAKSRSPQKPSTFNMVPDKARNDAENFEDDIEFPVDDAPLRLSTRRDAPTSPSQYTDDFDAEWAEGSIGVRFGGTRRGGRSNRSSSISAFSPSVSSCLTAESEDEGLDGLVLPEGPLNLDQSLKKRQQAQSPEPVAQANERNGSDQNFGNDDFFSGIDIGDGNVFDSGKLTLNQNIQRKNTRPASPPRTATTITFTNKPSPTNTRIPRLSGHERPHSTHLEPVSESGAPLPKFRRPNSRLTGHVSHASLSSIPTPSVGSTSSTPPTSTSRAIGKKSPSSVLRNEPTTTSAQLLKAKRSMPAMRNDHVPAPIPSFQRPSSRQDSNNRPTSSSRPKTPLAKTPSERSGTESRLGVNRKTQAPFIPAGASHNQSHHVRVKSSRHGRRNDSDSSSDIHHSIPHIARVNYSDSPEKSRGALAPEALAAAAKRTVTKPTRRRHFGDGTELEVFDDLPTSVSTESKFVKHPAGRGAPRSLRSKLSQSHVVPPSRTETPVPSTPLSPSRQDHTPRFARDTNASRNAREQRIASMTVHSKEREGGPLASLSTNWKAQAPMRGLSSPSAVRNKKRRAHGGSVDRPHLIKPMGNGVHAAKCKLPLPVFMFPDSMSTYSVFSYQGDEL